MMDRPAVPFDGASVVVEKDIIDRTISDQFDALNDVTAHLKHIRSDLDAVDEQQQTSFRHQVLDALAYISDQVTNTCEKTDAEQHTTETIATKGTEHDTTTPAVEEKTPLYPDLEVLEEDKLGIPQTESETEYMEDTATLPEAETNARRTRAATTS
ncbi:hypothetical protein Q1695_012093 [Nippostrongylus brasiliensis]|nr:hypothetical protein Q1695_012093 [Nippostrongylus brasiliensis]